MRFGHQGKFFWIFFEISHTSKRKLRPMPGKIGSVDWDAPDQDASWCLHGVLNHILAMAKVRQMYEWTAQAHHVCMYVCMYIYIYKYIHTHTYIHTCMHTHVPLSLIIMCVLLSQGFFGFWSYCVFWPCSKMRSFAPTYQVYDVELCRTTPSSLLSEAISQATAMEARSARRGTGKLHPI
jgi:hypothetical protein